MSRKYRRADWSNRLKVFNEATRKATPPFWIHFKFRPAVCRGQISNDWHGAEKRLKSICHFFAPSGGRSDLWINPCSFLAAQRSKMGTENQDQKASSSSMLKGRGSWGILRGYMAWRLFIEESSYYQLCYSQHPWSTVWLWSPDYVMQTPALKNNGGDTIQPSVNTVSMEHNRATNYNNDHSWHSFAPRCPVRDVSEMMSHTTTR